LPACFICQSRHGAFLLARVILAEYTITSIITGTALPVCGASPAADPSKSTAIHDRFLYWHYPRTSEPYQEKAIREKFLTNINENNDLRVHL
jgi:hypothetical protein